MSDYPTCEERIDNELADRIADIRRLWELEQQGEEDEELGSLNEYGLAFDYVPGGTFKGQTEGYFRWQLSWGGPSDEFRFYVAADKKPYRITYNFMDWYDGAVRVLDGENRQLLEEIWNDWFAEAVDLDRLIEKAEE